MASSSSSSSARDAENEILKRQIRDWIAVDNDVRRLKKELRQRTQDRDRMTAGLVDNMKRHSIDVVNLSDGHLRYEHRKVKKPVTQKMLLNLLATYFKGDVNEAEKVNSFILDNREEIVRDVLVRKIHAD